MGLEARQTRRISTAKPIIECFYAYIPKFLSPPSEKVGKRGSSKSYDWPRRFLFAICVYRAMTTWHCHRRNSQQISQERLQPPDPRRQFRAIEKKTIPNRYLLKRALSRSARTVTKGGRSAPPVSEKHKLKGRQAYYTAEMARRIKATSGPTRASYKYLRRRKSEKLLESRYPCPQGPTDYSLNPRLRSMWLDVDDVANRSRI